MKLSDLDSVCALADSVKRYREAEAMLSDPTRAVTIQMPCLGLVDLDDDVVKALRSNVRTKRYECEARLKVLGVSIPE